MKLHLAALNLFLYNVLLSHVLKHIAHCVNEPRQYPPSFWNRVPVLGQFLEDKNDQDVSSLDNDEFSEAMLNWNYFINGLIMLPGLLLVILKRRRLLSLLFAVVIIWNLFVFERILAFQLTLIWSLWTMETISWNFVGAMGVISFMSIFHLALIVGSIKMQHSYLRAALRMEVAAQLPGQQQEDEFAAVDEFFD